MIEVLETNADVSLYMVHKKPLLMDTGNWTFPTLKGAVQCPFPGAQGDCRYWRNSVCSERGRYHAAGDCCGN